MPAKIEGLKRFTVTLNADRLEYAQRKASKLGISPKISGNASAFLRLLIDEFADPAELRRALVRREQNEINDARQAANIGLEIARKLY